jgi:hypothetical protein
MKYAKFDAETGELVARYDSEINTLIPVGVVALDDATFFSTINEQDGIWKLVDGEVVKVDFPEPTADEVDAALLAASTAAVQSFLDAAPAERFYDGILSLCTYATSTVAKFAAEGLAGVEWRDAVWSKAAEILAAVQAGEREAPSIDELLAELPAFVWPDEVVDEVAS